MKNKICMFCGHKDIFNEYKISEKITDNLIDLIENKKVHTFYSGGMGNFDKLCEKCVRKLKNKYPVIRLCLIIPYMSKKILQNSEYYYQMYDEISEPDLGDVFYKRAIEKRNRWMVDNSDYIISFVFRDYGGAYNTLKYAIKKDVQIIDIND